ncbi:hypothetical protein VPH35_105017 [Triticum aestivum]
MAGSARPGLPRCRSCYPPLLCTDGPCVRGFASVELAPPPPFYSSQIARPASCSSSLPEFSTTSKQSRHDPPRVASPPSGPSARKLPLLPLVLGRRDPWTTRVPCRDAGGIP